ncbi:cysteine-rich receptor-like protein kinase 8 [Tanacetum coccineum]|uniref:Cysteine-rich receptor-like protein kinase 8 n=1 Tax=Tanacetum coccineum TaxID=301880 RepID=A0ABQ5AUX2_9ASTR
MVSEGSPSNTNTNPPSNDQITSDHPLFLLPTNHPGLVLIPGKLTGSDNYSSWRRSMVIALNAKNKLKLNQTALSCGCRSLQEEKQREGLLPKPTMSVAFSVNSNNQRSNNNYQRNYSRSNYSQGERRGSFTKGVICGNCNKEGHSREQCYKLVGYLVGHPLHGKFPPRPYKSQSQEYKPNRARIRRIFLMDTAYWSLEQ